MKNNSVRTITAVLYISLFIAFGFLYSNNPENQTFIVVLATSFILIQLFRYSIWEYTKIPIIPSIYAALIGIQFFLAFAIQVVDGSFVPQIYFFILIAEVAFYYRLTISILFTMTNYIAFALGVYINFNFPPFHEISFIIPRMLEYWLIFGFSYMAKRSYEQSNELEMAYQQLQIINSELEEKTLIEERIRISREIHDTVGHTLTTTLVGLEASKQLSVTGKNDKAIQKLDIVQEQIRKSLSEIRKSSKTLHDNPLFINFRDRLEELLKGTAERADITIQHTISDISTCRPDQELTVFRALQEGLTNGIKHGKATQFDFSLKEQNGYVLFQLNDNGSVKKNIEYGFGLTAMKERVTAIGGTMEIKLEQEHGCSLIISFPINNKIYQSLEVSS